MFLRLVSVSSLFLVSALAGANDRFMQLESLPDAVKGRFFLSTLQQQPGGCGAITEIISMGVDAQSEGHWTIVCQTASYLMTVRNDEKGSITINACDVPELKPACSGYIEASESVETLDAIDSSDKAGDGGVKEPLAGKEPSAEKEPSAGNKPSADKKPSKDTEVETEDTAESTTT